MLHTQSFCHLFHISHEVFRYQDAIEKKKFLHNKMGTKLSITTNMLFSRTVTFDYMINDK